MLDKLKILYPSVEEGVLSLLLDAAKQYAIDYCGLDCYNPELDGCVFRMVQEDVNALGAEGFGSESAEGSSVTYSPDYSDRVYRSLNRRKHVRCVR